MKKRYVILALIGTLVIGFSAGRISSKDGSDSSSSSAADSSGKSARVRTGDRPANEEAITSTSRLKQEIRKSAPGRLSPLVFRSLEIGDPLVRRQMLLEIFARMDAGNFEEMIRESERSSLETGRNNYDEWAVMLTRSGQVAGQAAVEIWAGDLRTNWDQSAKAMWGWSSTDPEAALKWLNSKQDMEPQARGNLLASLMAGAIANDRAKAMGMLAELPEEERTRCVPQFIHHMVQNAGKEGAVEWLKSVTATDKDSAYAKKVTEQVLDKIVWSGANQYNPTTIVYDLEQLSTAIPMNADHLARAVAQARARNPVSGLDLLDKLVQNPTLKQHAFAPQVADATVANAVKKDPAAVSAWLAKNPGSPIHGAVSQIYQNSLDQTAKPNP